MLALAVVLDGVPEALETLGTLPLCQPQTSHGIESLFAAN
jgi:hypothetical protein